MKHEKYHQNTQPLTIRSGNDIVLFQSIKEIVIGTRVCSLFDECLDKNFFGNVTHHFAEENLWHDDGDEEDMNVLDAAWHYAYTIVRRR